jgi:hypothetical protein
MIANLKTVIMDQTTALELSKDEIRRLVQGTTSMIHSNTENHLKLVDINRNSKLSEMSFNKPQTERENPVMSELEKTRA